MTNVVTDVNHRHLKTLEDAISVLLEHPIFETIQSMEPAPISAEAVQNHAGSQVP